MHVYARNTKGREMDKRDKIEDKRNDTRVNKQMITGPDDLFNSTIMVLTMVDYTHTHISK